MHFTKSFLFLLISILEMELYFPDLVKITAESEPWAAYKVFLKTKKVPKQERIS